MKRVCMMIVLAAALTACSKSTSGNGTAPAGGDAAAAAAPAGPPAAPEVRGGSLRDALAKGEATGRNVLVEYWSDTCPYCSQMERGALSDERVKQALPGVVYVRLTKDKDGESFVKRFGAQPTPSYVVMKPDGSALGSIVSGVVAADAFAAYVTWAKTGEGTPPQTAGKGG